MKQTILGICLLAVMLLAAACSAQPAAQTPLSDTAIPAFDHIFVLVLENRSFTDVIGSPHMPRFNALAKENTLLTQYTGVTHPSLPNYIAMVSGDTQGIEKDCKDCFVNAETLAERLEAAGRAWKTYQEDMPEPCFLGDAGEYVQKHNPFVYFDAVRMDAQRCAENVVPLTMLDTDLASGSLPNFSLIVPNMCNNGHDCASAVADEWIVGMVDRLRQAPAVQQSRYLIVVTYDESSSPKGVSGFVRRVTGRATERIATVLISPDAQPGFEDATAYNHYSLLKTILLAWDLPALGHTADDTVSAIRAPWKP